MSVQLAEQYEENEQYELALEEYKKAYKSNPKNAEVLERLGHISSILGKKDDAAEYYSKILEIDPTNVMVYEQLCDIYYSTDKYKYYTYRGNIKNLNQQYEYAINDYHKAITHTDNEEQILMARFACAGLYQALGNNNKAIEEYLKILDQQKQNEAAYLKLADIYVKENILAAGISTLEQALSYGITNPIVVEALAELYLKNSDYEKAMEVTKSDLMKIKCLLQLERLGEAKDCLEKAEKEYKNTPQFMILKAQVAFMEKDYDQAFEYIEKFNELEKNSPLYYQMRALIYEEKGDEFNELLSWAKYHILKHEPDIAQNEYLQAHAINPDNLDVVNALAIMYENANDKTHAMEFYEKIAKLDKNDKSVLIKLADFRGDIGDYSAQYDYLKMLLENDPKNAEGLKKMGKCCEKMKNYPDAVEYYNKFIKYSHDLTECNVISDKVKKLSGMKSEMDSSEGLLDKIMKFFNKES
ncbi:tetratricopeptide repeat protein [bacterium]|nr:tetratricopeptide repeat protein [bacterium]